MTSPATTNQALYSAREMIRALRGHLRHTLPATVGAVSKTSECEATILQSQTDRVLADLTAALPADWR